MFRILEALTEPTRFRIVKSLAGGRSHVSDLASILGLPVKNLSHHLQILAAAGIVDTTRQGRYVTYSLSKLFIAYSSDQLTLKFNMNNLHGELKLDLTGGKIGP